MSKRDLIVFSAFWLFYGIVCMLFPLFPDADWMNYHHYNCWSFLNDRLGVDFLASNSRVCINPIVNLPIYFLIHLLNNHPKILFFLSAVDTAGLFFVFYKILDLVVQKQNTFLSKSFIIWYSISYVLLSPAIIIGLDTVKNDTVLALFLLTAFYLFLKYYFVDEKQNCKKNRQVMLLISGVLTGTAFAFKLSVFGVAFSIGLLFLIFYKKSKRPLKSLFFWILGGVTGFFAVNGWWLAKCYSVYKNPLFPNYNGFFKSPFADAVNFSGNDYWFSSAKNIFEFLFYPFLKCDFFVRFFENFGVDYRFPIAYLSVILLLFLLKYRKNNPLEQIIKKEYLLSILAVVSVSYCVNLILFASLARYIISSILFCGLISTFVAIILSHFFKNQKKFTVCFLIGLLFFVYIFQKTGSLDWRFLEKDKPIKTVLNQPDLGFKDKSVVLFASINTSFLAVNQNKNVQYSRLQIPEKIFKKFERTQKYIDVYFYSKYFPSKTCEIMTQNLISGDKFLYVVFYEEDFLMLILESLDEYNLQRKSPRKLQNCFMPDGEIYSSKWGFGGNYICEFN